MFEIALGVGIFVVFLGVTELMRFVNRDRGGLPIPRWGTLGIALVLAVVVGVGLTALENILGTPKQHFSDKQPLPGVSQQPLTSTDLQKVEASLGPFKTLTNFAAQQPDTQYPAVLLIRQNGSVAASQRWTVQFTPDWTQRQAPQISALSVQGKFAHFRTEGERTYNVRCNQPFILESVPQYVMLIDEQGRQWAVNSKSAATTLRHTR